MNPFSIIHNIRRGFRGINSVVVTLSAIDSSSNNTRLFFSKNNGKLSNDIFKQSMQQRNQHTSTSTTGLPASLSPYYTRLPPGAKQRKVKSVTDGDTVILENEAKEKEKHRLGGIDAPEMKPIPPHVYVYAKEAKEYVESKCRKSDMIVHVSFGRFIGYKIICFKNGFFSYSFLYFFFDDPPGYKEDKYGRLITNIWVRSHLGFLNISEGLVVEGWSSHYLLRGATRLQNRDKLVTSSCPSYEYPHFNVLRHPRLKLSSPLTTN